MSSTGTPIHFEPLTLLPHRFPLLLVDRITSVEPGKRATGVKTVTGNEWSSVGSSRDAGAQSMPHLLIVEALAQLSAAVLVTLLEGSAGAIGYFLGINNVRFRSRAAPGDARRRLSKRRTDIVRADLTTIIRVADARERAALG